MGAALVLIGIAVVRIGPRVSDPWALIRGASLRRLFVR
jgi:hypothetical protein